LVRAGFPFYFHLFVGADRGVTRDVSAAHGRGGRAGWPWGGGDFFGFFVVGRGCGGGWAGSALPPFARMDGAGEGAGGRACWVCGSEFFSHKIPRVWCVGPQACIKECHLLKRCQDIANPRRAGGPRLGSGDSLRGLFISPRRGNVQWKGLPLLRKGGTVFVAFHREKGGRWGTGAKLCGARFRALAGRLRGGGGDGLVQKGFFSGAGGGLK